MKKRRRRFAMLSMLLVFLPSGGLTLYLMSAVERRITEEDRHYIELITERKPQRETFERLSYMEQIEFVAEVQSSVLAAAPTNKKIPYGSSREPRDLYLARHGLCFDRSWVIEKILISNGFQVRHVSVYSADGLRVPWLVLAVPGIPSHALSEVSTSKGWLLVDSNRLWLSIDHNLDPISVSTIQILGARNILWGDSRAPSPDPIFQSPFVHVYGLYSRHGRFFSPYVPVPDVHWGDLVSFVAG